jgi:hypothetical protein
MDYIWVIWKTLKDLLTTLHAYELRAADHSLLERAVAGMPNFVTLNVFTILTIASRRPTNGV